MRLTREFFIPKGATKVADKQSDATAYVYTDKNGRLCARMFFGRQGKPAWACYFHTAADRESSVLRSFEGRRARCAEARKRADERKAWVPTYKAGDIFRTCWGYDQTNVEFFEIVEIRGKMAVLRELQQESVVTGFMQGKCVPLPGQYTAHGVPIRRLMKEGRIKIDGARTAWPVERLNVAGIGIVKPASWTAYG